MLKSGVRLLMAGERRVWNGPGEVPDGVKTLGLNVMVPRVVIETPDGEQTPALMNSTIVFVEVSEQEWEAIGGDVATANAKAKELGPWLAAQFGGYVRNWHD